MSRLGCSRSDASFDRTSSAISVNSADVNLTAEKLNGIATRLPEQAPGDRLGAEP
jgi:hypothetical protein